MGASAYATGNHVAFARSPDVHTAAHEAAHVIQQSQGVSLSGGVGKPGDPYEKQADAVADRVVKGQSAESLLSSGQTGGSSSSGIQKTEAAGGAPENVILRLAGQVFRVRLPANPKKTVNLTINQTLGAFTLQRARLTFDESWNVKSGTVNGEANFGISGAACTARLRLRVGRNGVILSSAANADIQAGPLGGTCKLKVGQNGVKGTADITVNNDIALAAGDANLTLTAGAQAKVKIANSALKSANITALRGFVSDGQGKLVEIDGRARYTAQRITASGKATLARTLSKSLGSFELLLRQGDTQGEISVVGTKIKRLEANFAVDVAHARFGPVGTGTFNGTYANDGKRVTGQGDFTLGPNNLVFGNTGGFHVVAAQAGSSIGVSVARGGQPKLSLNVQSAVKMGERVLASGSAQNVVYDGTDLSGDFSLNIAVGFSFSIGPLTVSIKSADGVGLSYKGGELEVSGGNLSVDLDWAGKKFGLTWPNWQIALGQLTPLPNLELPNFDLSGFLDWFKGLGGFRLDWVFNLFKKLSLKLPQFNGGLWPRFVAWLRRFRLPLPNIPLIGMPSFDINLVIGEFWDGLLDFFGNFDFSLSLPKLKELFLGLDLGSFNFDWFKGWFANSNLGLETDGNFDISLNGENFPTIAGTDLSATLLWRGERIAALAAPNMSYDGTTFRAWINLTFERDFGIPAGRYKLCLKRISAELALQAGQPYQLTIPTIGLEFKEGRKKVAVGHVSDIAITESGVSFGQSSFGMTTKKKIPLGQSGEYTYFLKPRSAITGQINGGQLETLAAQNVGIEIKKNKKPFASGLVDLQYDAAGQIVTSASFSLTNQKKILLGETRGYSFFLKPRSAIGGTIRDGLLEKLEATLVGVEVKKGGQAVASGMFNLEYDALRETVTSAYFSMTTKKKVLIGGAGNYTFFLQPGSEVTGEVGDGQLLGFAAMNVGVEVKKDGAPLASGLFNLEYDGVDGVVRRANGTVSLSRPIQPISGLELSKGSVTAKIENDRLTEVSLSGVEAAFDRTFGDTPISVRGTANAVYRNDRIESVDATLNIARPITVGPRNARFSLNSGNFRLIVAEGAFEQLEFSDLGLSANLKGFGLEGSASGKITEAGVTVEESLLTLEKGRMFGTTAKGLKIHDNASMGVTVKDSVLENVALKNTAVTVYAGPVEATGALEGTYDGETVTEATATVTLNKAIGVGNPNYGGTLREGAEVSALIQNGELTEVAWTDVGFDANVRGVGFNGETAGKWTPTGIDLHFELGLAPESVGQTFTVGNFSFTPTGGSIHVDVEHSQLQSVTIRELGASVRYQAGDRVFALGLSLVEGTWDATEGISGTATVSLEEPITLGAGANQLVIASGSAELVLAADQLKSLSIANLVGKFVRNGEDLAIITVTEGTYDFEQGKVISATVGFMMGEGRQLKIGRRVSVYGMMGGFTLADDSMEMNAVGQVDVVFGNGKGFEGFVGVHWKQGPEGGLGDFAGTKGAVSGVLINDESKGRLLEASNLEVEITEGNVPLVSGGMNFSLNQEMGGDVEFATLKQGDDLVPVIESGSLSFQRELIDGNVLLDVDFGKKRPGLAPQVRGSAKTGISGGLKLESTALTAGTKIELEQPWRPLDGKLPPINTDVRLDWGLNFSGELLATFGIAIPVLKVIQLLVDLSGGVEGGVDIEFNPMLRVSTSDDDLKFDLNFALTISPEINAKLGFAFGIGVPILDLNVTLPELLVDFDLGTLFDIELRSGDGSKAFTETQGPPAKAVGQVPAEPTHGDISTQGGASDGALGGLQCGSKDQGGEPGGIAKLLEQARLVSAAAQALKGLGTLIGLAVEGIMAFVAAGPIGFAAWAFWKLVTGVIGEIEVACIQVKAGMPALIQLLGEFENEPGMEWLSDALSLLDSSASENAKEQVYARKHIGAPVETRALLLKALYRGTTGDYEESAILRIFMDSPDLEELLIATSGEIKAGIDEVWGEFHGEEASQLEAHLHERGLGWLLEVADDKYSRLMVASGLYERMTTMQRAKLLVMVTTGRVPTADEVTALKILEFSQEQGDVGGVLTGAFGNYPDALAQIRSGMHGSSHDRYIRWIRSFRKKACLLPSERWWDQLGELPAWARQPAREIFDRKIGINNLELTYHRALDVLATEAPFNRPLAGPMAQSAWEIMTASSPIVATSSPEEKAAIVEAVQGGELRHVKRPLMKAVLTGQGSIPLVGESKKFLTKLRNPDEP